MERLSDKAAFLVNHGIDDQVGVVEKAWLDAAEKKLRASVRFSKAMKAEEIYQDVIDGIRQKISVAYRIHNMVLENDVEGVQTYRVTDWEPYEVSIVSVPADTSVGIGRSAEPIEDEKIKEKIIIKTNEKGKNKMENEEKKLTFEQLANANIVRTNEIKAIAVKFKVDPKLAIESNATVEEFRAYAVNQFNPSAALPVNNGVELTPKEQKEYSVSNLIKSLRTGEKSFEKEVSEEISIKSGISPKGAFLNYNAKMQRRDLDAVTAGSGSQFIGTTQRGDLFIDVLLNKMCCSTLGVKVLSGLRGNLKIPKLSAGATYGWRATTNAALAESTPTTTQIELSPKSGGTFIDVDKQLLIQSEPSIDSILMNNLLNVCALGLDKAILHGTGANGQPTGIAATSGVGSVVGTALTYAGALSFLSKIEIANADVKTMSFCTTPAVKAALMSREKISGYPVFIMQDGQLIGYPVMVSNQISAGYIVFGDFSKIILALWGGVDLQVVTDSTLAVAGLQRIVINQYVDIGVEQAGAFAVTTNFS